MNYYNENDPKAAAWLRSLIKADLIPDGTVDERSICDVQGQDLEGFQQVHFFAGIGGWSRALQLASWPTDIPVWTGSCPCQPFSAAGKRRGEKDERHLWPEMRRLIDECGPAIVFGEQVASKDGRLWLDRVRAEMETLGYGFGAADLCAAGVNAPHIRQRLFWVADSEATEWLGLRKEHTGRRTSEVGGSSCNGCGMVQPNGTGRKSRWTSAKTARYGSSTNTASGNDFWSDFEIVFFTDEKSRRIEPGTFPLAHGIPGRVAQLRGLGNAIVPPLAAEFIGAFLDVARGDT